MDVHATPPIPPTPESPARPIWWRDGEDDERAAEMLYTLFSGESGESLAKELGEWVYRDTSIAAEAFPHVEFWRELDIRWVRYSCAHAGVGEALRQLKAAFARCALPPQALRTLPATRFVHATWGLAARPWLSLTLTARSSHDSHRSFNSTVPDSCLCVCIRLQRRGEASPRVDRWRRPGPA